MSLSNLQIFSSYLYTVYTETISQQVDIMNAASNNTLRLTTKRNQGDFGNNVIFGVVDGLVRRRNPYTSREVDTLNLGQKNIVSVRVAGGAGPVDLSPSQFAWIQMDPRAAAMALGEQLAKASLQDKVNAAIGSAVAALIQNTGVVYDATGTADKTASLRNLARASSKFGDRSSNIRAWVMHSVPAFDLLDKAIENSNDLYTIDNITFYKDAVGRPVIVTDSPFLLSTSGSPAVTKYHVLGLQENGVVVEDNDDFDFNMDKTNGHENILQTYQAEWSYNITVRGYSWDIANGGHAPTNAALTTSSNWDKWAADNKDVAGVVLEVL